MGDGLDFVPIGSNPRHMRDGSPGEPYSPRAIVEFPVPPPPLEFVAPDSEPDEPSTSFKIQVQEGELRQALLHHVKWTIAERRRSKAIVPDAVDSEVSRSVSDYVRSQVIHPITCLVNDLRNSEECEKIMYTIGPSQVPIHVHFLVESFEGPYRRDYIKAAPKLPHVLFYPPTTFDETPQNHTYGLDAPIPPGVLQGLDESTPLVLTDFYHVFIATGFDEQHKRLLCEYGTTSQFSLRYWLAGRLMRALPRYHIELNTTDWHDVMGAPNDPALGEPSDAELIATRRSHADFDRYALSRSTPAVNQFLRWKEAMRRQPAKQMEGDVVNATSWEFSRVGFPFCPRYPLEELPAATTVHLEQTRRKRYPDFEGRLKTSSSFTIRLGDELTPPNGLAFARTFVCQILQIDDLQIDVEVPSKLCVKIYDDRSAKVQDPKECLGGWIQNFYTAQDMLQTEENAYIRLQHAWGATVPMYYGSHLFTCADGMKRYGILMEYVPKISCTIKSLDEQSQISLIRSARHAIRVLQCADMIQADWGVKQMIFTSSPPSSDTGHPRVNCVLIDFGLAFQGDIWFDIEKQNDYGLMADCLILDTDSENPDGCPEALVREYYDPPDPWDFWAVKF